MVEMTTLSDYSRRLQFTTGQMPRLLSKYLATRSFERLLDLGCGDGNLLFAVHRSYPDVKLYGVDLSRKRLQRLREYYVREAHLYQADACKLNFLPDSLVDILTCTMLIEHVQDDRALLVEIHRVLREGGLLYISSVVKKRYGWWIYKCNGKVTCDPTHLREYRSKNDFEDLLRMQGFRVIETQMRPFCPSIFNAIMRLLVKAGLLHERTVRAWYLNAQWINWINKIFCLPAPGYFEIETVAVKED